MVQKLSFVCVVAKTQRFSHVKRQHNFEFQNNQVLDSKPSLSYSLNFH